METRIRDDLLDANDDVGISHILKHGFRWVVPYTVLKTREHRVALYNGEGEALARKRLLRGMGSDEQSARVA